MDSNDKFPPGSARELMESVGKTGSYTIKDLTFPVVILDTRSVYGRTRYLITPRDPLGWGEVWVETGLVVHP